jgi:hypothetical protein
MMNYVYFMHYRHPVVIDFYLPPSQRQIEKSFLSVLCDSSE